MELVRPPMPSAPISPSPRTRRNAALSLLALSTCAICAAPVLEAQSLLGSHESLLRQNQEAREHYPAHYHVAVFPSPYLQYGASGEALPEIQVARSTHETASRPHIVRASSHHATRRGSRRTAVAVSHRASSRHQKATARIVRA